MDSPDPATHVALGRAVHGRAIPTERYVALADLTRRLGLRLKVNTVVSALNVGQDFRPLLQALKPERWKVFQMLPIAGQNDGVEPLLVDAAAFAGFVDRHRRLVDAGIAVVPEDNAAMTGTYAMVSPDGRFYDNVTGRLRYGPAIQDVGLAAAWQGVRFDPQGFEDRGGRYAW